MAAAFSVGAIIFNFSGVLSDQGDEYAATDTVGDLLGRSVSETLRLVQARIGTARALSLEAINARSLPVKLRDGVARLFAPFL